jgi:S-formylglutathione hydrolase FrmB
MLPAVPLLCACLLISAPANAAGRAECRSLASKVLSRPVAYCVLLPPSYDVEKARRYPVLYFLHGLGENEQALLNSGGWNLMQDLWEQKRIGEFIVAAPDGDRTFYINSGDGRVRYEDFLMREFLPAVESRYRIRAGRRDRGISGVSMGGYGALRLALRYPALFGSASAHSAALIEKLPLAVLDAPEANTLARMLGGTFGTPFDPAVWDRNSPFTLVKSGANPAGMKIYFDCGTEDDFGFYKGARAFHELLLSRGIAHEFHLYPGGHSWSYFAQHFPASLEFHSEVFGRHH